MMKTSDVKGVNESYTLSGLHKNIWSSRSQDYIALIKPLFKAQFECVREHGKCYSFMGNVKIYTCVDSYIEEVKFCLKAWQDKGHLSNSMTVEEMMKELLSDD